MTRRFFVGTAAFVLILSALAFLPSTASASDSGIFYPSQNATAIGTVDIQGTASHPSFRKWQIDLILDGDPDSATFVAFGEDPVDGATTLATLDTSLYPDGEHQLRLRVVHSNLNYDEYFSPIRIGNTRTNSGRSGNVQSVQTIVKRTIEVPASASEQPIGKPIVSISETAASAAAAASAKPPKRVTNSHTLATRLDIPFDKTGRWIEVDLAAQTLRAWEADEIYLETLISSGKDWTPTVQGVFHVNRKVPSQRMTGPDYDLPNVQAVMYFFSNYAIHGAYWHDDFGESVSHGCVNMREGEAIDLFDWAPMGTPVFIYE